MSEMTPDQFVKQSKALIDWLFSDRSQGVQYFVHPQHEINKRVFPDMASKIELPLPEIPQFPIKLSLDTSMMPPAHTPFPQRDIVIPSPRKPVFQQPRLPIELFRAVAMKQTHGKWRKKKVKNTVILGDFVAANRDKALEMCWSFLRKTHKNPDGSVHLKNIVVVSDRFDADWSKIPGLTDPQLPVHLESYSIGRHHA